MEVLQRNISNLKNCATKWASMRLFVYIISRNTFYTVKNNKDIQSPWIFGKTFLYTAYADDTTFSLKNFGFDKWIAEKNFVIFIAFRFKSKLITIWSSQDRATESSESDSMWLQMYLEYFGICIWTTRIFFSYTKNIELEQKFRKKL